MRTLKETLNKAHINMFAPASFIKKTLKSREKTLSEGGSAVCEIPLSLERPESSKGF